MAGLCLCLVSTLALAGRLTRLDIERYFPRPFIVGERDGAMPAWPIFKQNATADELVA